jgi:protein-L-isoaspartate(D-aspartate) O-methyltransferase
MRNYPRKALLAAALFFTVCCASARAAITEKEFTRKREDMVSSQIKQRGVEDARVLRAMRKVRRHLFIPSEAGVQAYEDMALPIGEGQTISQPYIVALMTQLLKLKGNEKVLEIGTGSGYQAAILAELSREVYTIEILETLAAKAASLLHRLGYQNVRVKAGDGYLGWPEEAPFDAIIVTCAPEEIPPVLIQQLREGGRLVLPVGTKDWQELKCLTKKSGQLIISSVILVKFVPMIKGKQKKIPQR